MSCGDKQGTITGHWRHTTVGESPCRPCREARNAYQRARTAKTERLRIRAASFTDAHRDLAAQLAALPAPPLCDGNSLWTAEDRRSLQIAAQLCRDCPVLEACRAAGAHEKSGAWGGVVRDPAA